MICGTQRVEREHCTGQNLNTDSTLSPGACRGQARALENADKQSHMLVSAAKNMSSSGCNLYRHQLASQFADVSYTIRADSHLSRNHHMRVSEWFARGAATPLPLRPVTALLAGAPHLPCYLNASGRNAPCFCRLSTLARNLRFMDGWAGRQ